MSPGVQKTIFVCWSFSISFANTHCFENHFVAFSVECSLTVHVAWRVVWNCSFVFLLLWINSQLFSQCPARYCNCIFCKRNKQSYACILQICESTWLSRWLNCYWNYSRKHEI